MLPLSLQSLPQTFAQDVLSHTDIIRVSPSLDAPLRRSVTLKLPLPPACPPDQGLRPEELGVFQWSPGTGTWGVVEGQLKLTKNSVAFDTKSLTQ